MSLTPDISTGDHARGPLDAKVVVIHYGDFECPYSGALAPLLSEAKEQLGDDMCLIFRAFPLADLHPHALNAALAAEAAGAYFWQMHDLLFANQKSLADDALLAYAAQIGLDRDEFIAATKASAMRNAVEKSVESGHQSGAHGTPTVFVNRTFYDNDRQLWKSSKLGPILEAAL